MINVLRSLLKVFHGGGRFGCNRLDYFQHFSRGFAEIECTLLGQHYRYALFNAGRIIVVNLVSHQRSEQSWCPEQDEKECDYRDRPDHEQTSHDFISL